ncbi:hypothetical protein XENTR_v10020953 [Xenopus tropicalis]|nr:hypothetical protein XENTR_v10020953 [Xenopus tropicalis]
MYKVTQKFKAETHSNLPSHIKFLSCFERKYGRIFPKGRANSCFSLLFMYACKIDLFIHENLQ